MDNMAINTIGTNEPAQTNPVSDSSSEQVESETKFSRLFWPIMAVFCFFLTLLPTVLQSAYRTDVLHQLGIGTQWVRGTYMFPAFSTWILNFVRWICFDASFAPFLAAGLLSVFSSLGVWLLGCRFLSKQKAFFGAVALIAYWYFNLGSCMYNNNGSMTFFWIFALLAFYESLKTDRLIFWILTGLLCGASVISKYTGIILCMTIFLYMFWNRDARRFWRRPGPYASLIAAAVVFLPNALFILEHLTEIRAYIDSKAVHGNWLTFLKQFFGGWGTQILIAAPILLGLLPILNLKKRLSGKNRAEKSQVETAETSSKKTDLNDLNPNSKSSNNDSSPKKYSDFLLFVFFVPFLIMAVLQFFSGVAFHQNSYGYQLWPLVGLVLLRYFPGNLTKKTGRQALIFLCILAICEFASLAVTCTVSFHFSPKPSARFFPGQELSDKALAIWNRAWPDRPCPTVTGEYNEMEWHVGVMAPNPRPIINSPLGDWCNDSIVNQKGGLVLWPVDPKNRQSTTVPNDIKKRFPKADFAEIIEVRHQQKNPTIKPLVIGVGIIPPTD